MDAEKTEADVDAAAITMAADVTMDVITAGDFPAEIIPAAISCGSLFCCVCVEIMDADVTMDAATATAAGSSLYCFCFVAMAADVDADNLLFRQRAIPSAFSSG